MKEFFLGIIAVGVLAFLVLTIIPSEKGNPLKGANFPSFSEDGVSNTSATVVATGSQVIRRASTTGTYFRISHNTGPAVYCGLASTSTGLQDAGAALHVTGTADRVWEMWGYKGDVYCISAATATVGIIIK